MKIKIKRVTFLFGIVFMLGVSIFLIPYSPHNAVRLELCLKAHPVIAVEAKITKLTKHNYSKLSEMNSRLGNYVITPRLLDKTTGTEYQEFSIKKKGLFYFAKINYRTAWA